MRTRTGDRACAKPSARPAVPLPDPDWQRIQGEMVARIAGHALEGGTRRAGPHADEVTAIDAYLEILRHDLLAEASRRGG